MQLHPELHRAIAHDTERRRLARVRELVGAQSGPPAVLVATVTASQEEPCPVSAV